MCVVYGVWWEVYGMWCVVCGVWWEVGGGRWEGCVVVVKGTRGDGATR